MISESLLNKAVERGILSPGQLADLHALVLSDAPQLAEPEDDERLRFITGFGDIFVTLGLLLFTGALGYLTFKGGGGAAMWVVLSTTAWLLAEFFTRRRRMALPSIVLLILFAVAVFFCVGHVLGFILDPFRSSTYYHREIIPFSHAAIVTGAGLLTIVLSTLHYRRFRVPITLAAACAAFVVALIASVDLIAPEFFDAYRSLIIFACGLGVFGLAMFFDLSDPQRITRRTDIAFWLHLLAAPMIVHPLITNLMMESGTEDSVTRAGVAVGVLAIFIALGMVAVVIDRRAMLVSGLTYAGYACTSLIQQVGLTDISIPATLLALGAFVLLLSAGWRPLRTNLLKLLPDNLARKLPHPILTP